MLDSSRQLLKLPVPGVPPQTGCLRISRCWGLDLDRLFFSSAEDGSDVLPVLRNTDQSHRIGVRNSCENAQKVLCTVPSKY